MTSKNTTVFSTLLTLFIIVTRSLLCLSVSLMSEMKLNNKLTKLNSIRLIADMISIILYMDALSMLLSTEPENVIPATKATTIDENMPKIVMYSRCIRSAFSSIVLTFDKMSPFSLLKICSILALSLFV